MSKWIIIVLLLPSIVFAGTGSVRVRGRLLCHGAPLANTTVAIYDKINFWPDEKWNSDTVDRHGHFSIDASGFATFGVVPYFYAEFKCQKLFLSYCYNFLRIKIPKDYVAKSHFPERTLDIGEFELSKPYENDRVGQMDFLEIFVGGSQTRCFI